MNVFEYFSYAQTKKIRVFIEQDLEIFQYILYAHCTRCDRQDNINLLLEYVENL